MHTSVQKLFIWKFYAETDIFLPEFVLDYKQISIGRDDLEELKLIYWQINVFGD